MHLYSARLLPHPHKRPLILDLPHLDPILPQPGIRALFEVGGQVLVDVLEHQVQRHLALPPRAVAYIKQSVEREKKKRLYILR